MSRIILEMGSGNDLYGMDYTKAARRAIQDALHHSSLIFFRSLDLDTAQMEVRVTIGVQEPNKLDLEALAAELPRGKATIIPAFGGQNVEDADNGTMHVIATAAIEAFYDIDPNDWKISER